MVGVVEQLVILPLDTRLRFQFHTIGNLLYLESRRHDVAPRTIFKCLYTCTGASITIFPVPRQKFLLLALGLAGHFDPGCG
jgi:hypothetical protein